MNDNRTEGWGIRKRAEAPFIIGLLLVAVIAMADFTILGRQFGTDSWKGQYPWANTYALEEIRTINYDAVLEHRPWFEFARSEMLAGHLPLWNPYSFTGTPLYANHLCPVLYPPLTISLLVFDGDAIAGWLAVFHLMIFGISLYCFLRTLDIKTWPAFITSCAAQFTGICFVLWSPWASVVAWAPAILALYEAYRRTRKISYLAWGGLIYGIMAMAAFPVIAVHFTYFLLLYIIIREFSAPSGIKHILVASLLVCVLGIIISGVQNIPTAVYSADTYRSAKYEHSMAFLDPPPPPGVMEAEEMPDISPLQSAILAKGRFFTPVAQLRIIDNRHYIGAPLLLFGIIGLFLMPRKRRHWLYLFIAFLLVSFIDPLYDFLMRVLPLWKIRDYEPREIWQLTCLVCAGYGVQGLLDRAASNLRVTFKGLLVVFAILLTAFVATALLIEAKTATKIFPLNPGLIEATGIHYISALGLIVLVIFAILFGSRIRQGYFIAIFLIAIILGGIPSRILALPYTSDVPTFSPPEASFISTLEKYTGVDKRVARVTSDEYYLNFYKRIKVPFLANLTTLYNIKDIAGYDSFISRRTVDYINLLQQNSIKSLRTHISFTDKAILSKDLFRSLAVGCIISDMAQLPVETKATRFGDVYIHEIKEAGPRYYLARKVRVLDNSDLVKPYLLHDGWSEAREVYIDGSGLSEKERRKIELDEPFGIDVGTIVPIDETSRRVSFEVNVVSPTLLILNDAYAPGWKVRIDGAEAKCLNANLLFRAAYIPKGKYTVEFVYRPSYMAWGWLSTIIGLAVFLGIVLRKPKE